jgi:hypothetical protein
MKNHHHGAPVAPATNSKTQIHEAIAARAYSLWERQGKPDNQADALWLQAERELVAERMGRTQDDKSR